MTVDWFINYNAQISYMYEESNEYEGDMREVNWLLYEVTRFDLMICFKI